MQVTHIKLVLLVYVAAKDDENLTEESAKAAADALLAEYDTPDEWSFSGVEWHNYDQVTVVYIAVDGGNTEDDS